MGFEKPSAIQQKAIKPFLEGKDLIAQAQSGTGKTATFGISILQSIDENLKGNSSCNCLTYTRVIKSDLYCSDKSFFIHGCFTLSSNRWYKC